MQQERDVNREAALAHDDIAASAQRAQPAPDEQYGRQVRQQQVLDQDDYIARHSTVCSRLRVTLRRRPRTTGGLRTTSRRNSTGGHE